MRNRYQKGSLRKVHRKSGVDVWEYRFRNHAEHGSPMRQLTLSVLEYPTETKALIRLQEDVLRINDPKAFKAHNKPTLGLVIDRFSTVERLEEIVCQPPGEATILDGFSWSTAHGYRSYLSKHVRPKWGNTPIAEIKALAVDRKSVV